MNTMKSKYTTYTQKTKQNKTNKQKTNTKTKQTNKQKIIINKLTCRLQKYQQTLVNLNTLRFTNDFSHKIVSGWLFEFLKVIQCV